MVMPKRSNGVIPCVRCGDLRTIARKLCRKCYTELWKTGAHKALPKLSPTDVFLTKFKRTDGCWLWTGNKNGYGYGILLLPGEIPVRAHRFSFEHFNGPIPEGMVVRHTCDNPPCVNPDHLLLGTKAENNRDTAVRRRHHYGLDHWNGRLSPDDIMAIMTSPLPGKDLAKEFGVTANYIYILRRGGRK